MNLIPIALGLLVGWAVFDTKTSPENLPGEPDKLPTNKKRRGRKKKKQS